MQIGEEMKESGEKAAVSIICEAYNHGPYIKDALEGFVNQKTTFPFVVLVHDDASTDNTADVIREYEKKYPALIKAICQTENQYSKGVNITETYGLPRVEGEYVALCEGDDYWTDPRKLQKQYEAMEQHPEIDICAHAAQKIRATNGQKLGRVEPSKEQVIFNTEKVIAGGGGFVATNSLFFRKKLLEEKASYYRYFSIDYALQIQGSIRGGMLYLPEVMSVYRVLVPGSWTSRLSNVQNAYNQAAKIEKMLNLVDEETGGRYHELIQHCKLKARFSCLEGANCYKELRNGELKKLYDEQPLQWKIKTHVKEKFPGLLKLYRR